MNIYEILGVLAAVVTIIGFMWSIKRDLGMKFDSLHTDMQAQIQRIDLQAQRTDKLYTLMMDLVYKIGVK